MFVPDVTKSALNITFLLQNMARRSRDGGDEFSDGALSEVVRALSHYLRIGAEGVCSQVICASTEPRRIGDGDQMAEKKEDNQQPVVGKKPGPTEDEIRKRAYEIYLP